MVFACLLIALVGLDWPRWSFGHLLNPPRRVRARTSPLLRLRAVCFKHFMALVPFCFGPVFRLGRSTHKCTLLNYMTPDMTLSYRPNLPELN